MHLHGPVRPCTNVQQGAERDARRCSSSDSSADYSDSGRKRRCSRHCSSYHHDTRTGKINGPFPNLKAIFLFLFRRPVFHGFHIAADHTSYFFIKSCSKLPAGVTYKGGAYFCPRSILVRTPLLQILSKRPAQCLSLQAWSSCNIFVLGASPDGTFPAYYPGGYPQVSVRAAGKHQQAAFRISSFRIFFL